MIYIISHYGTEISIALRIFSTIILVLFVLPLQIKEANVKNGLHKLRLQMLFLGLTIIFVNIIASFILFDIIIRNLFISLNSKLLQMTNATAFVVLSIICSNIYHQQFTHEQKVLHEKIEKLEKEASKND